MKVAESTRKLPTTHENAKELGRHTRVAECTRVGGQMSQLGFNMSQSLSLSPLSPQWDIGPQHVSVPTQINS